jgi:hypothetical protein
MMMILDLHQQGLAVSAIAKATSAGCETVRKYIERGLDAPAYGPANRGTRSSIPSRTICASTLLAIPG